MLPAPKACFDDHHQSNRMNMFEITRQLVEYSFCHGSRQNNAR